MDDCALCGAPPSFGMAVAFTPRRIWLCHPVRTGDGRDCFRLWHVHGHRPKQQRKAG